MTVTPLAGGRVLVTGCAGFLGSRLAERLVADGCDVVGVDCFVPYYPRAVKERNLERLREEHGFSLLELDLARAPLDGLLEDVDVVFHLAAQAGVRGSFGESFAVYLRNNVFVTQRLLEQAARSQISAFVYASSSSVYGDAPSWPTSELSERRPVSPYGMTKVATEELAAVYLRCFGVPAVGLRYFTAYGPRQRPDMAARRMCEALAGGRPFTVYGDGSAARDLTHVDDAVDAALRALAAPTAAAIYNVGGGRPVSLRAIAAALGDIAGRPVPWRAGRAAQGDVRRTSADTALARRDLGWRPSVGLRDGLVSQLSWVLERHAVTLTRG